MEKYEPSVLSLSLDQRARRYHLNLREYILHAFHVHCTIKAKKRKERKEKEGRISVLTDARHRYFSNVVSDKLWK